MAVHGADVAVHCHVSTVKCHVSTVTVNDGFQEEEEEEDDDDDDDNDDEDDDDSSTSTQLSSQNRVDYCESMQSVLTSKRSRGIGAKLREAKRATKAWVTAENLKHGESVENLEKRISSIDKELLRVQSGSREESALKVEAQNLNTKLWNRYRRDEREWLQKSRVRWFKEGDKNTRFFHLSASLRSNMNFIRCITVGNHIIRDQVEISKAFEEHFNVSFNDSKTIPVKNFPGEFNQLSQESGYSRNSVELWKPILKKFHDRLEGWKGRLLSFGGRLTLLRSVFNNLPVYFMSLIQIPAGVADSLNKIMANFLWGLDSRRAIHWVKWEHVCRPKDHGGLGIFNVLLRNRSLLNKRICRFGSENGAFWRNVIDAKYGFDSLSLMPKQLSDRKASWLWRGIAKPLSNSNDLFSSGIRFKLGDGSRIEFWEDFLTEVRTLREAFPRIFNLSVKKSGKVGQFGHKESDKWVWSIATRRELFDWERRMWEEFMNVIERAASNTGREDKLVWINARDGDYSTNVYCLKASTLDAEPDKIWNVVWSGLVPPKVEGFLWKALLGRVLTLVELAKRGIFSTCSVIVKLFGGCGRDGQRCGISI
ncbi:hypothetical protein GQ457_16G022390 [Hibiscus cannabinus]